MSSTIPNSYQTPNWLVDDLLRWLEPNEWVALSFMVRHILGWREKIEDRRNRISLSQFEDGVNENMGGCGLSRPQITKALKGLVKFRVVRKVGNATKDGQQWELFDHPEIDWDGLKMRREAKAKKGRKRVKKAAVASAEARRNDDTGTSDVPPQGYATRTPSSTTDVPEQEYAGRTPSGTLDVPQAGTPGVHTKHNNKPNVVVDQTESDSDSSQQQQRDPHPAERQLFIEHHIPEDVWRSWMIRDAETVMATVLHATSEPNVKKPVGLMRSMLVHERGVPLAKYRQAARAKLSNNGDGRDSDAHLRDIAHQVGKWDPRAIDNPVALDLARELLQQAGGDPARITGEMYDEAQAKYHDQVLKPIEETAAALQAQSEQAQRQREAQRSEIVQAVRARRVAQAVTTAVAAAGAS